MRCKVKVKKGALDYFRKLARRTELEIQAYLVGQVVSPELTVIKKIIYPKRYHTQTASEVAWYNEDYEKIRAEAEEEGLQIVGDIHSHPNYWPVPSETDHCSHIKEGHRLVGICATMNGKTKIYFWIQESSLPCKIVYE